MRPAGRRFVRPGVATSIMLHGVAGKGRGGGMYNHIRRLVARGLSGIVLNIENTLLIPTKAFILLIYVCNPDSILVALDDYVFKSAIISNSASFAN